MAISKVLVAFSFLCLLVVQQVQAIQSDQVTSSVVSQDGSYNKNMDCKAACAVRCSLSSRPNLCKRACGTCCYRCNCVPSGTNGHYDECACYANMTTRGNKRKCP